MNGGAFVLTIAPDPVVRDALQRAQIPVRVATSPYDLVVLAATLRPMLVVVDRTTDDAAALAALEALDSPHLERLPVVILSAEDEPDEAGDQGVFILGPRDLGALLRIVRRTTAASLALH